jgi:hypothetical protein
MSELAAAPDRSTRVTYAVLLAVTVIGIPVAGLVPAGIHTRWIVTVGLILVFLLSISRLQTSTVLGFLVDSRNKTSSSRLQMLAWTIVIVSAYSTAALTNVRLGAPDPLAVAIPPAIWAALGIGVASFVGSPLIKQRQVGDLVVNHVPSEARATDVLMGEGQGSAQTLDLGKIQMLLFTLVIVVAYCAAIYRMFGDRQAAGASIGAFPTVDPGMLALLGISHSGYLASKSAGQRQP